MIMRAASIVLHARCIAIKALRGRPIVWHWRHILREFGLGPLSR